MAWQEFKWILPLVVFFLAAMPWSTLIGWARKEVQKSRKKDVL
jgi:hypothetical protein